MKKNPTSKHRCQSRVALREHFASACVKIATRDGVKLLAKKNNRGCARFGVVLSRGFSTAVVRNRAKRCVGEFLRKHYKELPVGLDLVFVVYPLFDCAVKSYPAVIRRVLLSLSSPRPSSLNQDKGIGLYE